MKRNTLVHVLGSPRLLMGTGYAIYLLNSPGEAYVLDPTGTKPFVLSGTVLDWLREMKSNWLVAGAWPGAPADPAALTATQALLFC